MPSGPDPELTFVVLRPIPEKRVPPCKIDKMTNRYEGSDLLVETLKHLGVWHIFSVSGGVINSIYSAAATHGMSLVHTRHGAAAAFMAEAIGRPRPACRALQR